MWDYRTKITGYFLGTPSTSLGKLFPNFLGFLEIKKLGLRAKFFGKLGTFFGKNSWGIPRKPGKLGKLGNGAKFLRKPGKLGNGANFLGKVGKIYGLNFSGNFRQIEKHRYSKSFAKLVVAFTSIYDG